MQWLKYLKYKVCLDEKESELWNDPKSHIFNVGGSRLFTQTAKNTKKNCSPFTQSIATDDEPSLWKLHNKHFC